MYLPSIPPQGIVENKTGRENFSGQCDISLLPGKAKNGLNLVGRQLERWILTYLGYLTEYVYFPEVQRKRKKQEKALDFHSHD